MVLKRKSRGKVLLPRPRRTKRGDAFLDRARRTLGTDEAKFTWMLRLAEVDMDQIPDAALGELNHEAWFIIDRGEGRGFADVQHKPWPLERQLWLRIQQDVGAFLRNLAEDNIHVYKIQTDSGTPMLDERFVKPWVVMPSTAWKAGEHWEWVFMRGKGRLHRRFYGTLPTQLLFAAADLLDRLGADRLKVCPLKVDEKTCRRLFLARRAQKFCSRQHAARAAWLRWLHRHHGGTRAKRLITA